MVISMMVNGQTTTELDVESYSLKMDLSLSECLLKIKLMAMLNSKILKAICFKQKMKKLKQCSYSVSRLQYKEIIVLTRSNLEVLLTVNYISKYLC